MDPAIGRPASPRRPAGLRSGHLAACAIPLLAGAAAAAGCQDAPGPAPVCGPAPADPPDCGRIGGLVELRQVAHPGRGTELDLRLVDACGAALPSSYAACLAVPEGVAVAERALDPGRTLLVVAPPRPGDEATRAAIAAFAAARPASEPIALWRWGERLDQLSDFTLDRTHLVRAAELGLGAPDPAPLGPTDAVAEALEAVERVAGVGALEARGLVLVGAAGTEAARHDASAATWIQLEGDAAGLVRAAESASAALDRAAAAGAAALGACGASELRLDVPATGLGATLPIDAVLPDEEAAACDPSAAARGERAYPRRIELRFTPELRAIYDERVAANSRDDFPVAVKLGAADFVAAKAHLRGYGSLRCERKSFTVNLDGPWPRHLLPGAATDEFFLISNCWDNEYVQGYTAFQILERLGLAPFRFDFVQVVIDGESQGVYLLVEKHTEELVRDSARPLAIVRRRHEAQDQAPRLKWVADPGVEAMPAYDALLETARAHDGEELVARMWDRLSLSSYLQWVATMTTLKNGDWGDEVFFLATEGPGRELHFRPIAWDPDDILRAECVWEIHSYWDPWGLVYCAEGLLEHELLADPVVHALYAQELERALDRITVEDFERALDATAARLLPFLEDPGIRAASIELDSPATYEEAEARVRRRLRLIGDRFASWHAELQVRLAVYRAWGPAQ